MRAWLFQDSRQKAKLGDKCPWSVGWYDHAGRKRSKKLGAKSIADKYRRKIEGELALRIAEGPTRKRWSDFRERFTDAIVSLKSTGTANAYKEALDNFERIAKPVYMDAITNETIDVFRARRSRERRRTTAKPGSDASKRKTAKVSPATVNKDLRHLRAALRKAYKWGLVPKTPDVELLREPERDPYFIDDAAFAALYDACASMTRPRSQNYPAAEWWRALFCFAYMTGWRISEILDLRRDDVDLETGIATVDAESTKGRRTARVELHAVVIDHLRAIVGFSPFVFDWPHHERLLWTDFTTLKKAAGLDFAGAFHRFRFGFANANVDHVDADILQRLMRHRDAQTTRHYINAAERMKRAGMADRLHVPANLRVTAS